MLYRGHRGGPALPGVGRAESRRRACALLPGKVTGGSPLPSRGPRCSRRRRACSRARGAMLSRADQLAHTQIALVALQAGPPLRFAASRYRFNSIPAFLCAVRAAARSGRGWRGAAAHVEGAVTASAKSAWRLCLLGRPARRKRHISSHTASVPWKRQAEGVILARAPTSPTHAAIRTCSRSWSSRMPLPAALTSDHGIYILLFHSRVLPRC